MNFQDKLGAILVRCGINRYNYAVAPGIYSSGNPTKNSPVLVSANYKLSFDILRSNIKGLDAWIMVIDTKGINVWCAAGEGTFGTDEIVNRIKLVKLDQVVEHKKIILPQLGAPGVSAREVQEKTGFSVIYGPVRAEDIKKFIGNNFQADKKMREVTFNFYDRLKLVPMEVVIGLPSFILAMAVLFLLGGSSAARSMMNIFYAYFSGAVLGPLLLPWLPGKSFSAKGFWAGMIGAALSCYTGFLGASRSEVVGWLFFMPAVSSFLLMNFTGASTYTSISGVKKEMGIAVPLQAAAFVVGILLWGYNRFF